jgi:predicted ATPase/class 3 adenylate cyclase/Tfp pilus assembly protein PilF
MTVRPTGTVTFLFTDIEGSTNLARSFPEDWPGLQARHYAILEEAITAHHGVIFRTVGDEVNAAFPTALDALAAALAAQNALHTEDWGAVGSVPVRMGLHTGPAAPSGDDYEGYLTLSHVKRLMSTAYGEQILVSEATEALLGDSLPSGVNLKNLGKHRLKDFERVEPIFQVVVQGLPSEFPPLKSLVASPQKIPLPLTSFIGRSKEMGDVMELLSKERLVTLTGPSGSGKTRLALQAAAEIASQFPDGAYFVALASITDPGLVASTIAQCLDLTETPGRSIADRLKEDLHRKKLLLVLDNFEQVIQAAPLVADLLVSCTACKILVTSREGLRISGEREYPVPPLELPDRTRLPSTESLAGYAAVALFLQRAMAVKPDFRITEDAAPAVAEICMRLDGLPLAIELAAARIKVLPPRAMLARLEHRLEFLTGGARDVPKRQQTLRNAIAWSYDLLNEDEQRLFRRLSVFVGGCTIEAAEAVTGDPSDPVSVLDGLGSLLDKSLLHEVGGTSSGSRFGMLETLREFGLEQLAASGEQDMIQRRHAAYFLAMAEQAEASRERAEQVDWLQQMEQEHGNLRAALEWSQTADGAAETSLRLAGALGYFWEARGHFSEGRERLAGVLETDAAQGRTAARARLLARAAELAYRQSDYPATISYAGESLEIYRQLDDRQGMAAALVKLGNAATERGDYAAAAGFLDEALAIWRERKDNHGIARALISLGWIALRPGDYPLARARLEEALALSRELGDTRSMGFALSGLGEIALRQGDYRQAVQLVGESLKLRRQLGHKWGMGVSLGILGWAALRQGDLPHAMEQLEESLDVRREIGDPSGSAWCLERLAEIALARGQAEKAVRLFGAGAALRAAIHSVLDPADRPGYDEAIRSLQAELGNERFAQTWEEGGALTLDQAVAYALER